MKCFNTCDLPRCEDLLTVPEPSYKTLFLGATFTGLETSTWDGFFILAILLSMIWVASSGCKHVDTLGDLFDLPKSFHRPSGIAIGLAVWLIFLGLNWRRLYDNTLDFRLLVLWEILLRTTCGMQLAVWFFQGLCFACCGVAWVVCWFLPSCGTCAACTTPPPPTTTTTPSAGKTSAPDPTTTTTGTAEASTVSAEEKSAAAPTTGASQD